MINIICIGKIKEEYLKELVSDYQSRIGKYHKINIIELKEGKSLDYEANDILKCIKPNDYVIALVIEGKNLNSVSLANLINDTFNHYGTIDFVIGESNGLSEIIKNRANYLLSFSNMTFPHGLFRGILLEQIYRSFKIINNESYHK
jgi:23S rRNA (pseudouridine1915-N3)-methyltransferase